MAGKYSECEWGTNGSYLFQYQADTLMSWPSFKLTRIFTTPPCGNLRPSLQHARAHLTYCRCPNLSPWSSMFLRFVLLWVSGKWIWLAAVNLHLEKTLEKQRALKKPPSQPSQSNSQISVRIMWRANNRPGVELSGPRVMSSSSLETFPLVEGIGILLGELAAPPSTLFLQDAPRR